MKKVSNLFKKEHELIADYINIISNILSTEESNIVVFASKDKESDYKSFCKKLVRLGTMKLKDNRKIELMVFRNTGNRLLKMRKNNQDVLITSSLWLEKL